MKITVNAAKKTGAFVDPTCYQNSTLRYAPPKDFPAYAKGRIGKAKIMRAWITLDEYYDYKTKEIFPDYDIGVARYKLEERYYPYDWASVRPAPSGTRFRDFLTSHAKEADEVLLNVRRYEREVSDGIISYEEYEKIFENAVEYCKSLAPNIRYVECCNEVDIKSFGNLTAEEYVKIYVCAYRAIKRLNEKHKYDIPLLIGGYAAAHPINRYEMMEDILSLLAKSGLGDAPMDFYSYHHYEIPITSRMIARGMVEKSRLSPVGKLRYIVKFHRDLINRLGLADRPIFLNEVGMAHATKYDTDNQMNAAYLITFLLATGSEGLEDVSMFPWCTFHNPILQISFTQFLLSLDGSYKATPCGLAIEMLHNLSGKDRLEYSLSDTDWKDGEFSAIAVANDEEITIIATNPSPYTQPFELFISNLAGEEYSMDCYRVERKLNNAVTGNGTGELTCTDTINLEKKDGGFYICTPLAPESFVQFKIKL